MSAPLTKYVGTGDGAAVIGGDFVDQHEPVPGKSEWGMDTLTRTVRGIQPNLVAYIAALSQGATYTFNSGTYYLQSFEPDDNPIFPSVSLHYKGLHGGIPDPKVSGATIEQTLTLTCNSPQEASREIRYYTRQSTYRYIATARPGYPTYGAPDVDYTPVIFDSVIRTGDGGLFYGNAPADLVTALTPVGVVDRAVMHCDPVVGSIYFECEDVVTRMLPGGS